MKNLQTKLTGFVKKNKTLSVILALVIVLCLWWAYASFMPHPLGNKMEYLGKEDYGNIFGFDSAPNSEYYYGTDMDAGEIAEYFNGTVIENGATLNGTVEFGIKLPSGETIYSRLTPATQSKYKTTKKSVMDIPSFKYNAAKKYLSK
jgi:hypothetical protein